MPEGGKMNTSNEWQVPGSWVEIYENIFGPAMMGEWVPRVVALTNLRPGEHVLDVACGTGALTRHAAKIVGRQGRVVGLDLSPEMLAVARTVDGSDDVIEWREGDVSAMPFEDGTFDIVYCAFGLMFFSNRMVALKEMRRVLKPEGLIALAVWGAMRHCPGQMALKETWERHFGPDGAAGFSRMHCLDDLDVIRSLLNDAGFSAVLVQPTRGTVRWPSPAHLVSSYGALAGMVADERTRSQVIDEVSAALQPYIGAEGLVYPIEAILANAKKLGVK
jgi:SAM-dependent methyltransferase